MIRWIASYPKSGNTWIRLFLLTYENGAVDINRRNHNYKQDIDPHFFKYVSPVALTELTVEEAFALRGAALVWLSRFARQRSGAPLFLKTHCAKVSHCSVSLVPATLTDRALYLIRDPRDVAVSYADHLGKSVDETIATMADETHAIRKGPLEQPTRTWSQHVRSWMTADRQFPRFAVRYEDMLADPAHWFRQILNFFNLPFDRERFDAALRLTSFDHLRKTEDHYGFGPKSSNQKRFFRKGKAGAWRDVLTRDQVARIEADHGEVMKMCNYELDF